jgi:hypothetical protein
MRIEHIALWTTDLERCKQLHISYFDAVPGTGYLNVAVLVDATLLDNQQPFRYTGCTTAAGGTDEPRVS